MEKIHWPKEFPEKESMISVIKDTISVSWKNDLTVEDVQQWLGNFTGKVFTDEEEQLLALWMLCNFTFYNEAEITHLCKIIYKNLLHDIAEKYNLNTDKKITEMFQRTYFAAIGKAGESGGLLLYYFRQEAEISMDRFCYPSALPSDDENILVFIDDVTLSGDTAARFFSQNIKSFHYKQAYYITLFASNEAINRLSEYGINVLYCILLDDRDKCFSDNSVIFSKYTELRRDAKKMAEAYGKAIEPEMALGYNDGQYCFGFHYNTPNNSLPIFWSKNGWYPIFQRKEKIYNVGQRKNEFEKYI